MDANSLPAADTKQPTLRWFHPTPGRSLIVLLAVEGILFLTDQLGCWHKGYAVLVAIGCIGVTMVLILLWWMLALCFRWRFQFSLRSLFVLTVVVAIPFSWMAVEMKKAREQREVVEWIVELGGSIYSHPLDLNLQEFCTSYSQPVPTEPDWLRRALGDDFFRRIVCVNLGGTQVTDSQLARLEGLRQLHTLFLTGTRITDSGLRHLQELHQLPWLYLRHTSVTDEGVKELQKALPTCHIEH